MVNSDDFIQRLNIIFRYYDLSASVFADKVGVQRSGLSHLLSGRNKPSLDFIMKITETFPEVDLYWLLNGTGSFPKKDDTESTPSTPTPSPSYSKIEPLPIDLFSANETPAPKDMVNGNKITTVKPEGKNIDRIVIFYTDGTFKDYTPEN